MIRCRIAGFLFKVLPWKRSKDVLIRRHGEVCPHCRAVLASREEALALLFHEADMRSSDALWSGIRKRMRETEREEEKPGAVHEWIKRYAAGATGMIAAAVMAVFLIRGFKTETVPAAAAASASGVLVHSILVEGRPAQAVIYLPQGSDMIIIWAESAQEGRLTP